MYLSAVFEAEWWSWAKTSELACTTPFRVARLRAQSAFSGTEARHSRGMLRDWVCLSLTCTETARPVACWKAVLVFPELVESRSWSTAGTDKISSYFGQELAMCLSTLGPPGKTHSAKVKDYWSSFQAYSKDREGIKSTVQQGWLCSHS